MYAFVKILFFVGLVAMVVSSMMTDLEARSAVYLITIVTWSIDACICVILFNKAK